MSPYRPPVAPYPVDTSHTSQTLYPYRVEAVSHKPHTYWHHSRSIAQEHDCIFLTNVANLPPPDAVVYQPHAGRNFSQWEHELGDSPDLWKEGKQWALAWGYYDAVDGDYRSAFRSPDSESKRIVSSMKRVAWLTMWCSHSGRGLHWPRPAKSNTGRNQASYQCPHHTGAFQDNLTGTQAGSFDGWLQLGEFMAAEAHGHWQFF